MRDFFKYTGATLLGLTVFLSLGIGAIALLFALAAAGDKGPRVEKDSVLVLDLSQEIRDAEPSITTNEALQKSLSGVESTTLALRTVVKSIDKAIADKRIVGLYLQGTSTPSLSGYATLMEVRQALKRFRDSGKPILAFDRDWSEREYFLGSVANTIYLDPLGEVVINGLGSETMFLGGALQKYGIGVQVVRVGKYKAAVEPFTRSQPSPESRQQTQQLLGDLWTVFLNTVGDYRKLDATAIQAIASSGGLLAAEEAKVQKIIDRVAYEDEVIVELKKLTKEDATEQSFRQIDFGTYAQAAKVIPTQADEDSDRIAVVYAEGSIVDGEGSLDQIGGDRYALLLRELRLDKHIKAVVFRVNSPGGSATASEAIKREVELIAKEKPFIVSMGNMAASGGYWVSMKATRIFAEPNTITGSIGVFGLLFNIQDLGQRNGLNWDVVKTAPFADAQTISRPKTPQELAILQKIVDRVYDRFISEVSSSRKLPKPKVNEIAQGRVWSGLSAKNLGLVDEIGGLEAAINFAATKTKLGKNPAIQEYPHTPTLEEQLLENFLGEDSDKVAPDALTLEWHKLQAELKSWTALNDPSGIYMRVPYNFRID
jgi:protease IV